MVEMNLAGQFCSFSPSFLPPLHFKKTICSFLAFYSSKDQRGCDDWMAPLHSGEGGNCGTTMLGLGAPFPREAALGLC